MGRKSIQGERREEILDHFCQAVIEDGLEGASTVNVARRAGIRTSLLMHSFPSKVLLVRGMVKRLISTYESNFLPELAQVKAPADRIRHIVRTLLGDTWEFLDQQGLFYTCYSLSFRDPEVKGEFQRLFVHLRNFLIDELQSAMTQGAIPYQNPEDLADLIITIVEGKGLYQPLGQSETWARRQSEFLIDTLERSIFHHRERP